MSSTIELARRLMAIMSPVTGTRSTGTLTVTASGADVTLDKGLFAVPILNNTYDDEQPVVVLPGPNADKSWTITSSGTDVSVTSNIGGIRQNFADKTPFFFDPTISGIESAVANGAFASGADFSGLGVRSMVVYEQLRPGQENVDMLKSTISNWPAIMVVWTDSEPADGSTVTHTTRATRTSNTTNLYQETFQVWIIIDATSSDHTRRSEGVRIMDTITSLLTDRHAVDGVPFSNPSGIQIKRRFRRPLGGVNGLIQYYLYGISLSIMQPFCQVYDRTYNDLELINIDVLKPQDPTLPNQGDYVLIDDMQVDMTP